VAHLSILIPHGPPFRIVTLASVPSPCKYANLLALGSPFESENQPTGRPFKQNPSHSLLSSNFRFSFSFFLPLTRFPGYCRVIHHRQPFCDTCFQCYLRQTRCLQSTAAGEVHFCGPEPHLNLREGPEPGRRASRPKYTVLPGSRYHRILSSFLNRLVFYRSGH
jgi:hypothetical protein